MMENQTDQTVTPGSEIISSRSKQQTHNFGALRSGHRIEARMQPGRESTKNIR